MRGNQTFIHTSSIVDPETARDWLNESGTNRKINPEFVDRYADMMKNGQWTLSPQGLAFNNQGQLLDGQHRLHAVIESNNPQEFIIFEGWGPETIRVMDAGMQRMAHQALQITTEHKATRYTVAALRIMCTPIGYQNAKDVPVTSLQALYDNYRGAIIFVEQSRVKVAPVMAAALRAYDCSHDNNRIKEFLELFEDGVLTERGSERRDQAAISLRDFYLREYRKGKGHAMDFYQRALRALEDFLRNIPKKIIHPIKDQKQQPFKLNPSPAEIAKDPTLTTL